MKCHYTYKKQFVNGLVAFKKQMSEKNKANQEKQIHKHVDGIKNNARGPQEILRIVCNIYITLHLSIHSLKTNVAEFY